MIVIFYLSGSFLLLPVYTVYRLASTFHILCQLPDMAELLDAAWSCSLWFSQEPYWWKSSPFHRSKHWGSEKASNSGRVTRLDGTLTPHPAPAPHYSIASSVIWFQPFHPALLPTKGRASARLGFQTSLRPQAQPLWLPRANAEPKACPTQAACSAAPATHWSPARPSAEGLGWSGGICPLRQFPATRLGLSEVGCSGKVSLLRLTQVRP